MRGSTMVILFGILACVGFLLFEPQGLLSDGDVPTPPGLLFPNTEGINELSCDIDGRKMAFDMLDGVWTFAKPKGAPVRAGAMQRILGRLGNVRANSVLGLAEVAARKLSLAELGLDPPVGRIRIKDGGRTRTLLLGEATPFDNSIYARMADADEVMTVPKEILGIFPEDPLSLRDMSLGFPEPQGVARIELERAEGFVQVSRNDQQTWVLTQPETARLDQAKFESYLNSIASARIEQIVTDDPGELGQYGLVENMAELRWWLEGDVNPARLRLGAPVPAQTNLVYAQLDRFPTIFSIHKGMRGLLDIPITEFRDRRILPMAPSEIAAIRIVGGEDTVTLGREDTGWTLLEPFRYPAEPKRIDDMVQAWSSATARSFPQTDIPTLLGTNAPPQFTLVFTPQKAGTAQDAATIRQMDVYRSERRYFAHLKQEDVVAEVSAPLVSSLSVNPLTYCDRAMLRLDPSNIIHVVRSDAEGPVVFQRGDNNTWQEENDDCILNESLFLTMLDQACRVAATRMVAVDPENLAKFGLTKPVLELTLSVREGSLLRQTLLLGGSLPSGGGRYAMVRGREPNFVFVVDGEVVNDLLTPFCLKIP